MELLTLEEAALIMGVSVERARQLAVGGRLQAVKKGGRWLVPSRAAHGRIRNPRAGRPLSSRVAWLVVKAAQEKPHSEDNAVHSQALASPREVRRLQNVISFVPPVDQWSWWLRGRAESQTFWVHPGLLERLRQDQLVILGGAWAAAANGSQIRPSDDALELYVEQKVVADLVAEYRLSADEQEPNVRMRVVGNPPGGPAVAGTARCVSDVVAAIDLLDSSEARHRDWSRRVLESAHARLLHLELSSNGSARHRG